MKDILYLIMIVDQKRGTFLYVDCEPEGERSTITTALPKVYGSRETKP
jgi:hypothetical protein